MNFDGTHLDSIFETQPWLTRNCLDISHGRTPLCANSTILCRTTSGNGRPLTKTPPNWFTPPWPATRKLRTSLLSFHSTIHHLKYYFENKSWKFLGSFIYLKKKRGIVDIPLQVERKWNLNRIEHSFIDRDETEKNDFIFFIFDASTDQYSSGGRNSRLTCRTHNACSEHICHFCTYSGLFYFALVHKPSCTRARKCIFSIYAKRM